LPATPNKEKAKMRPKGKIFFASIIIGSLLVISAPYLSAMDGPDVVELDTLVNIYEPVAFDHTMHVEVASCATCHHHTTGEPAKDEKCLRCHQESGEADEVACTGCHPENRGSAEKARALMYTDLFHNDTAGLKRAYHLKCLGCHTEMDSPTGCEDCHPKRDDGDNLASAGN
jgi:hypothetical protein